MNALKLIPSWLYWAAIGVLLLAVGGQQVRVANLKTDLAQEKQARSDETAERATAAYDYAELLRKLASAHAAAQQNNEDKYAAHLKKLESARAADAVVNQRLRDQIADFTAGSRRPGESDAAALERAARRLQIVGGIFAEGSSLLTEGLGIIERRDAEVGRLLSQIADDRAACSASAK